MRILLLAATTAALIGSMPLAAQSVQVPQAPTGAADPATAGTPLPYDRGYDKDSPRTEAIDASGRPAVQAANDQVLTDSSAKTADGALSVSPQYVSDVASYRAAVRAHRQDVRHYGRQERAYAQAMADWRAQAAACERGNNAVCRLPAPDPADYM